MTDHIHYEGVRAYSCNDPACHSEDNLNRLERLASTYRVQRDEAWSVLRELVPLLYYNTTPEYIDAVKRARALLAKVE
jgi:branched-subunit amino acid aminotransferase/4-amino-4-deoxychorismate lyase